MRRFPCLFYSTTVRVKVYGPGQVSWLWKMRIDSVSSAPPRRDTKKMSIKHIYLLGDRHYVNKVKFLLV